MRIDDWVCLGRTVPEESKKYGHKVCSAGWSQELRDFVRVYPLPVICPIKQRAMCQLELTRNANDSRRESWKLKREDCNCINVVGEAAKTSMRSVFNERLAESIDQLNKDRRSLSVIRPEGHVQLELRRRDDVRDPLQTLLFEDCDAAFGANSVCLAPYLRFWDSIGKEHCLQLREWGCYEYIRKHPHNASGLRDALKLDGRDIYLFVGNLSNCRNVWLVISVWSFETSKQAEMFP